MKTAIVNCRIFTGETFLSRENVVIIEEDRINSISNKLVESSVDRVVDLRNNILAPGFFDTQVNGGGGQLFNSLPNVETIETIGKAHRKFGTCNFLPTLISDDLSVVKKAIEAVDQAISSGVPGVIGIHIEGPFLNTDRKGIHDSEKFLELKKHHIDLLSSLKNGKTLITLAPENASLELISELRNRGIIVAAGHTNASYATMQAALGAGIRGFTHLFNAMSQLGNREPGVVGAALEDQESWCGIIADGKHVSNAVLKIAFKCKPIEKFVLVTDAMPTVGSTSDSFQLQTKKIRSLDGVCIDETGILAGSDLNMAQAVRNAHVLCDMSIENALSSASLHPAQFMKVDAKIGRIVPGFLANLVTLTDNFQITNTWINGQLQTN